MEDFVDGPQPEAYDWRQEPYSQAEDMPPRESDSRDTFRLVLAAIALIFAVVLLVSLPRYQNSPELMPTMESEAAR